MTIESTFPRAEPVPPPLDRQPRPRQRILVVEDNAAIRRLNTEALTYSGYQVDSRENGAVAWEALQRHTYDLMVTDNEMPVLTGMELIRVLHEARMALPVIMATGALPDSQLTRYKLVQPVIVLLKPYTFNELLAAVKEVLRGGTDPLAATLPDGWQSAVAATLEAAQSVSPPGLHVG